MEGCIQLSLLMYCMVELFATSVDRQLTKQTLKQKLRNKRSGSADEAPLECHDDYNIRCPNVELCIMIWLIGDGHNDCGFAGVEEREPVRSDMCNCVGGYKCPSGPWNCLPPSMLCDGANDCNGGDDETSSVCYKHLNTDNMCAHSGSFLCDDCSPRPRCIPQSWRCDRVRDCPGGQDEAGCPVSKPASPNCQVSGVPYVDKSGLSPNCWVGSQQRTMCYLEKVGGGANIIDNCLHAHNYARRFHSSPDLAWDTDLEITARRYAKELPEKNSLVHSTYGSYGENIFWTGSAYQADMSCADMVMKWYSEVKYPQSYGGVRWYDYSKGSQQGTDYFTQLIWKQTKSVGCAIVRTEQAKITPYGGSYKWFEFWGVCQYLPGFVYNSIFQQNILQPNPPQIYETELMDNSYDLELNGICFVKYPECTLNNPCNTAREPNCPVQCDPACQ